jgi:hypothetical protein
VVCRGERATYDGVSEGLARLGLVNFLFDSAGDPSCVRGWEMKGSAGVKEMLSAAR